MTPPASRERRITKAVNPISRVHIFSILHQWIKIVTFRKFEKSSFVWFSGLVKFVTPMFDLHKPPHRKPIQQQPFNNYSSRLQARLFSQEKKLRNTATVSNSFEQQNVILKHTKPDFPWRLNVFEQISRNPRNMSDAKPRESCISA